MGTTHVLVSVLSVALLTECASGNGDVLIRQDRPPAITLTQDRLLGRIPIDPELREGRTGVMEVTIDSIENPTRLPFTIFVYLEREASEPGAPPDRTPMGNFSPHPPEQKGTFMLDTSTGANWPRLIAVATSLTFELRPIGDAIITEPLEVTISRPRWR